jgi:hypothetical protein
MKIKGQLKYSCMYPSIEVSGQLHAPTVLIPRGKDGSTSFIGCVSPKAVLEGVEKRKSLAYIGNRNNGL